MLHKPLVYVSRITNLSDARYCAGMGVDLLGYVVDPTDPDYVSPEAYQQLLGWISGPARVIETGSSLPDLKKITETYAPEYLHVSWTQLSQLPVGSLKLIVEIPYEDLRNLMPRSDIAHVLVSGAPEKRIMAPNGVTALISHIPDGKSLHNLLDITGADGIALRGSKEVTPGLKDYDHLSKVLEELESK